VFGGYQPHSTEKNLAPAGFFVFADENFSIVTLKNLCLYKSS